MDAGARASGEGVQRFDAGSLVAADGSESAPVPMQLPGNCHAHGACIHTYRIKFNHDPAAAGTTQYVLYVPQFTGRMQVSLNGVPMLDTRSAERGVRTECVSTCRSRGSPDH